MTADAYAVFVILTLFDQRKQRKGTRSCLHLFCFTYMCMKMNQKWIRSEGECEYDVNLQCSNVWKISDVLEPNLTLKFSFAEYIFEERYKNNF